MKQRIAIGVLSVLIVALLGSWCWYFATRPEPIVRPRVRIVPRPQVAPVPMRAASAKERGAAIRSIVAQLEAFKADRYDLATKFQSKALKRNFSSVDHFREVITAGYPQFAHYKKARFGAARATADGKSLSIPITLVGEDGVTVTAAYTLILEEGVFRVASVTGGSAPGESTPQAPPGFEKIAPLVT